MLVLAFAVLALATPAVAAAEDAGVTAADADAPMPDDPRVAWLHALMEGTLDVGVDPQALFDVPLSDEPALQVEAARVRALLQAVEPPPAPATSSRAAKARVAASAEKDAGPPLDLEGVDALTWTRRLALDRARLAFYTLPKARRDELLRAHAASIEAASPKETAEQRRARESAAEHERALAEARAARTEAERLVAEELARLISVDTQVAVVRDRLHAAREELAKRRDAVLGWQRRVRDAKSAGSVEAAATYDALARALDASRDDLSSALDALEGAPSDVPSLDADPLTQLPSEVPTEHVRDRRTSVERAVADARREEAELRAARASEVLDEMTVLQREQLDLLPHLAREKRDAITAFTATGWEQARSEVRHLSLVVRYHQRVARRWLASVRADGSAAISPWRTVALVVPLLVVVGCFVWARRRTRSLLRFAEARVRSADRAERRATPSFAHHAVRVLSKTHGPLEWIAFFTVVLRLLPHDARSLLEVQLVSYAVTWILAGALVVSMVDAIAAGRATHAVFDDDVVGQLRLRSLRLVGRTVVAFALILGLSARLVGAGTIHSWVLSTCGFAGLPVFLVLVRWWRGTVFERLDRTRKKTRIQAWVLANRSGWKSFGAAMLGAIQLFVTGGLKTARSWVSGFYLARRAHAYLFKREIARLGDGHAQVDLVSLPSSALSQLHPERKLTRWIPCPSDDVLFALTRRTTERLGGLVAVVGARGMGKSSLLRTLRESASDAVTIACRSGMALADVRAASGLPTSRPRAVLLDDAHALVKPCIGGLAVFDEVVAFARANDDDVTWVFAVDSSVWPLLQRARDARPVFDQIEVLAPWDEAQIGALLAERCREARIDPKYDDLLEKLPPGSDEIDRQDALKAKQASYERMLWDHVGGNPGLALEAWRASLGAHASGAVHVRPLQVPDASRLEGLPDSSLFVLRAVLQLAPATVDGLAEATRLRPEEVLQDVRFGQTLGIFTGDEGHVRIAWPWLREVTHLLERRHLLVPP